MRYAKWTLMIVILILAASAAWAQCPTAQVAQVQCAAPCPAPQQPCPQACPQVCPCPASVPAATGAGPASLLQGIQCPDFDPAYASRMYAQNSVIIAVTDYGMQRAHDNNLRSISSEINHYLTSANNKLQSWYGAATCGVVSPDCTQAQAIIAELSSTSDQCFDAVYATTLSQLLKQSNAADTIGAQQAVNSQMRQQAGFMAGKEENWSFRLDRWVNEHGQPTY